MSIEHGAPDANSARQQEVLDNAAERYGQDAQFVYMHPADKQPVTMTLAQAMMICGPMIMREGDESLWTTLDKWNRAANTLREKFPEHYQKSLGRAAAILEARVGESGTTQ